MYGENIPFPRDLRHTLALAKEYADVKQEEAKASGGTGYEESHKASFPLWHEGEPDASGLGQDFYWVSALTPSKEGLANGSITVEIEGAGTFPDFTIYPLFDSAVLYGGPLNGSIPGARLCVVMIAYEIGEHTITDAYGDTHTLNIPRKGIYVNENGSGVGCTLHLAWNEIHPIDSKFLPDNTLGEDVWGDSIETAFVAAVEKVTTTGGMGVGVANFVVDDIEAFYAKCENADKLRWSMTNSMGTTNEAHIAAKNFVDGKVQQMSVSGLGSTGSAILSFNLQIAVGYNNGRHFVWVYVFASPLGTTETT